MKAAWLPYILPHNTTKIAFIRARLYSQSVNELDEVWANMLAQAAENARAELRHDVADYLDLKHSNDLVRSAAVGWLFDTLVEFASRLGRENHPVSIERIEPYSFKHHGANIVGSSVCFRYGVRCLTVEAGWTRTPADGFIRGGGLAIARLRHFGMPRANGELTLLRSADTLVWRSSLGVDADSAHLLQHLSLLIDDR